MCVHMAHSYLVLGDAHSNLSVTEEGDQRGSGRVLFIIIGRATFVVELDHPVVIGEFSITQSQVPRLLIPKTNKRSLRKDTETKRPEVLQCHDAEGAAGTRTQACKTTLLPT